MYMTTICGCPTGSSTPDLLTPIYVTAQSLLGVVDVLSVVMFSPLKTYQTVHFGYVSLLYAISASTRLSLEVTGVWSVGRGSRWKRPVHFGYKETAWTKT